MASECGDEGKCGVETSASSGEGHASHAVAEVGSSLVVSPWPCASKPNPRTANDNLASRDRRWVRGYGVESRGASWAIHVKWRLGCGLRCPALG
jgi:hypothetical protein